jgi:hypothetical protein
LRFRFHDVSIGAGTRVFVALLDQEPALVAAVLAAMALDERPAALQLLATQLELELSLPIRCIGVADRFPFAAVP